MGSIDDKIPKDCKPMYHLRNRYCLTYCCRPMTEENRCPYVKDPVKSWPAGIYHCDKPVEIPRQHKQQTSKRKKR